MAAVLMRRQIVLVATNCCSRLAKDVWGRSECHAVITLILTIYPKTVNSDQPQSVSPWSFRWNRGQRPMPLNQKSSETRQEF